VFTIAPCKGYRLVFTFAELLSLRWSHTEPGAFDIKAQSSLTRTLPRSLFQMKEEGRKGTPTRALQPDLDLRKAFLFVFI
jgi:hypothetical protein